MSSTAQIDANRQNAILSTGPRSAAGKSAVSRNAESHGLSAASPVLASEDPAAFDSLLNALIAELQPQSEHETFLVQQMAGARWRLARARHIETAAFDLMLGEASPEDPHVRMAQSLDQGGGDLLAKIERYASAAERSYYKAHKELLLSQAQRARQQAALNQPGESLLDLLLRPAVSKTKPIPECITDKQFDRLLQPRATVTFSAPKIKREKPQAAAAGNPEPVSLACAVDATGSK